MICESKRADDLVSSTRSRRLARQVRTMRRYVDDSGVVAVVLRGGVPSFDDVECSDVIVNLVRLQCLGVALLPCPAGDRQLYERLLVYRELLVPGSRSPLAAVAGSDNPLKHSGYSLVGMKGLGAKRVDALLRFAVERATSEELQGLLRSKKLTERLREVVG